MSTPFRIRRAVPSDVEYILKTWGREMRGSYVRMPERLFYNWFQGIMLRLVQTQDARVICDPSDPDVIWGFCVGKWVPEARIMTVHFAYVRPAFRRLGLTTAALKDMGYEDGCEVVATFSSRYIERFRNDLFIYNPDVAWGLKI